jgi:hypothetical protein
MILNELNISFDSENEISIANRIQNDLDKPFIFDDNLINNDISPNFEANNFLLISSENKLNLNSSINIEKLICRIEKDIKLKPFFEIKKDIPSPFLEKDIINKFKIMDFDKETKIKFISCINKASDKKEEIKDKLLLKPNERRKNLGGVREIKDKNIKNIIKSGRKKKSDISNRFHNKYSSDNLIDKIKNMINISLVSFCNKIISSIYEDKIKIKEIFSSARLSKKISKTKIIKDINYNFIYNKKKAHEILDLLNITIKDYLCNKISQKYANTPDEYNKLIINQLLLDNKYKDIFDFIFNHIKIKDWFDLFIYKKDLKDISKYKSLKRNEKIIIKNNLVRINDYLIKIYQKDETYFQCLVMCIYNFNRFLMVKEERNRNQN